MFMLWYFPCRNMFNTLQTVCFMYGLSIYEIKRISHRADLYIISPGNLQHLTIFLNRWKNNTSLVLIIELKVLQSSASFFLSI